MRLRSGVLVQEASAAYLPLGVPVASPDEMIIDHDKAAPVVADRTVVEVLFFEDCPNYQPTVSRVRELLRQLHVKADLVQREVTSDEVAVQLRFLGSPTVRVNGRDVDPNVSDRDDEYALSCRLYQTPSGLVGSPPDEWIVSALDRFGSRPSGTT